MRFLYQYFLSLEYSFSPPPAAFPRNYRRNKTMVSGETGMDSVVITIIRSGKKLAIPEIEPATSCPQVLYTLPTELHEHEINRIYPFPDKLCFLLSAILVF